MRPSRASARWRAWPATPTGPSFSPDGRRLAFIGTDVEDPPDELPPSLWVMDLPVRHPAPPDAGPRPPHRRVGVVRPADGGGDARTGVAVGFRAGGDRRRPRPRPSVPGDVGRSCRADGRPRPADRGVGRRRRRRPGRDLGRPRRPRRRGLDGRGWRAAPGDPRGIGLAAPLRGRRPRGAHAPRTGGTDPGLARLAARRRQAAPADDPPHPRRPDRRVGSRRAPSTRWRCARPATAC